jgi:hypothetical protein
MGTRKCRSPFYSSYYGRRPKFFISDHDKNIPFLKLAYYHLTVPNTFGFWFSDHGTFELMNDVSINIILVQFWNIYIYIYMRFINYVEAKYYIM